MKDSGSPKFTCSVTNDIIGAVLCVRGLLGERFILGHLIHGTYWVGDTGYFIFLCFCLILKIRQMCLGFNAVIHTTCLAQSFFNV